MIPLNVVSMERSMSNSTSNTKILPKRLIALMSFVIFPKFTKMGRIIIYQVNFNV